MYKDERELFYRVFRVIFGSDILTYDLVFALIYRKPNNDVVTFVFKYGQVPVQQLQETQSAHILLIKKTIFGRLDNSCPKREEVIWNDTNEKLSDF